MSQSYFVAPTVVRVVDGGLVASSGGREYKLSPLAFHLDTHRKDVQYRKVEGGGHIILIGRPVQRVYRFDDAVVAFMKSANVSKPAVRKPVMATTRISEAAVLGIIAACARVRIAKEAEAAPKRARRRGKPQMVAAATA